MARALSVLVVALALAAFAGSASAAFPGQNGRIAYTFSVGDDTQEFFMYSIRPDGRSRRSFRQGGVDPAYSPLGRRIVYADPYGHGLRVIRSDGRGRAKVVTRNEAYAPDWSPSGRRIVFMRFIYMNGEIRSQLRILENGRSRALTDGSDPAWSVKGVIAFLREDPVTGASGIYTIRPDGSGLREVVSGGSTPDWSPDGRRIAFTSYGPAFGASVSTVRPDGSGLRRLGPGMEPAFSPDGHRLAYIGRQRRLRTMSLNGTRSRLVPHSHGFYEEEEPDDPDWQPLPRPRG